MIFYNSQLMKNESQLRLYLASNPDAFTRFEDHEAALQIQLYDLVERAIAENEDPIALIEAYLQVSYNGTDTVDDIANFLIHTGQMRHAMHNLKENWDEMDETLPELSLKYASTSREQAIQVYSEITLRSYLEALSEVFE